MKSEEVSTKKVEKSEKDDSSSVSKIVLKSNNLNIVLLVLFLLFAIPLLTFMLFTTESTKRIFDCEMKGQYKCDDCGKENNPVKKEECECEKCECKECNEIVTNQGWIKHTATDVKVNLETPSYTTKQNLMGQQITSSWDVRMWQVDYKESLYFDSYNKTISAYFFPIIIPEGLGCGSGCVKENLVNIHVFKNSANLTLEQARDRYLEEFEKESQDDGTISGEIKTKWNERTYQFKESTPGGGSFGNLLVKNGYIYQVTYTLTSSGESLMNAQKVVDSIKFN